ncbi:hypothetical protein BH24ACT4_BH24ACT4_04840 [soil metagenome]
MTRRLTFLLAAPFALLLVLSGCSDDDGGDASPTSADDSGDSSEGDSNSSDSEGEGDLDAFCTAYDELGDELDSLPNDTLEDIQAGARVGVESAEELAELAPAEVKDDAETQVEGFKQLQELADSADSLEDAQAASGEIDDTEFSAASDRLKDFNDEQCPA